MCESEVTQSCPTPSDPMDCSLPGSSVHRICQARVLEWVAIAFSNHLYTFSNFRCPPFFCHFIFDSHPFEKPQSFPHHSDTFTVALESYLWHLPWHHLIFPIMKSHKEPKQQEPAFVSAATIIFIKVIVSENFSITIKHTKVACIFISAGSKRIFHLRVDLDNSLNQDMC